MAALQMRNTGSSGNVWPGGFYGTINLEEKSQTSQKYLKKKKGKFVKVLAALLHFGSGANYRD